MGAPTNAQVDALRPTPCVRNTLESKHLVDTDRGVWIKRSSKPSDWRKDDENYLHVPKFGVERILNEGACLEFIAKHMDIPVPKVVACFQDDGAAYLVTEIVEGIPMSKLKDEGQRVVMKELHRHLTTMESLKSDTWGGPGGLGIVLPLPRMKEKMRGLRWFMRPRRRADLIFCHNALSVDSILVDPETLKITGIFDWEHAGFFPFGFEPEWVELSMVPSRRPSRSLDPNIDLLLAEDVMMSMLFKERW